MLTASVTGKKPACSAYNLLSLNVCLYLCNENVTPESGRPSRRCPWRGEAIIMVATPYLASRLRGPVAQVKRRSFTVTHS